MAELSADGPWPGEGQTFEDRFYGLYQPPPDRAAEIKTYLMQNYNLTESDVDKIIAACSELLVE